jgi:hypothetical protein
MPNDQDTQGVRKDLRPKIAQRVDKAVSCHLRTQTKADHEQGQSDGEDPSDNASRREIE